MEAFVFSITGQPISIRKIAFQRRRTGRTALARELRPKKLPARIISRRRFALRPTRISCRFSLSTAISRRPSANPSLKWSRNTPTETLVDVTFPVDPGRQYKVSCHPARRVYKVFPVEAARAHPYAARPDRERACSSTQDVEAIKKLYGTRGYMGSQHPPRPEMNDANSTVKYVSSLRKASIYKMGDLEIRGLDCKATERIGDDWRLRGGETYDSGYPRQFLDRAPTGFPPIGGLELQRPRIAQSTGQDSGRNSAFRSQALR